MCGICGTAGFARERQLEKMSAVIAHRGPDDMGVKILQRREIPWIGLAHRRLSIIDLSSAGHQPMSNEDDSVWVAYNGEIFNFIELRSRLESGHRFRSRTDTEVLIHLYEERGIDFLNDLNGMFALALFDQKEDHLLLARDPFGIKPLYYMPLPGGQLAFASEIKSFLAGDLLNPEVDPEVLHYYLNFLWVPGPKTLFKGVFKLQPGHILLWKEGEFQTRQYWEGKPTDSSPDRTEADRIEELRVLLEDAVRRHLISDVPLGVFLSGGLDSSALLALGTKITNRSMKAYTIAFRAEDSKLEQSNQDLVFARQIAKELNAEHHEIELQPDVTDLLPKIVWHMDEPVADPAAIASYLICKAAHDQVTVLLSGQGGDEIFGGYRVHLEDRFSRPLAAFPSAVRDRILLPVWDRLPALREYIPGVRPGKVLAFHRYFRKVLRGAGLPAPARYVFHRSYYGPGAQAGLYTEDFQAQVREFDPYETHLQYFRRVSDAHFVDQMLFVDQKTFLPELNLTYSDKMSMAASIEARVPLLDQNLATFVRGLPHHYKLKGMKQKYLFKRAMEGMLPKELVWRGKAGFGAPIRTWLQVDLREMMGDLLSERSIKSRGYFDPNAIAKLVRAQEEQVEDYTYQLWAFLTLELWIRTWVEEPTSHLTDPEPGGPLAQL